MSALTVRADGDRSIAVGGDVIHSILITGDHAKVFVGDYVDLADSYIEPWEIFERVELPRYVQRPWLTESLDQFLATHDRGYLVVEAQAGLGKTTFMAHLATTRGCIHHFVELAPGDEGIIPSIKNLASQLIVAWKLLPDNSLHVPVSSVSPEYLRSCVYKAALQRDALRPNEAIVLVIDGLDQAGRTRGGAPLGLPRQLPKGVYVIVSQRPGSEMFFPTTSQALLTIDQSDVRNIDDLRSYVQKAVAEEPIQSLFRKAGVDADDLQRLIVDRSEGVWIYAYYVLAEIRSELRSPESLSSLPIGLWRYHAEFFGAWRGRNKKLWDSLGLDLLASLAVYQEPLSFDELHLVSKFEPQSLAKDLLSGDWAPFVTMKTDRGVRFHLYHASTRDFILGTLDQPADLTFAGRTFALDLSTRCAKIHEDIATSYFLAWGMPSDGFPRLDPHSVADRCGYGTRFLPEHLLAAGRSRELHETLVATQKTSNAWYELKNHQDDLELYLSHLSLARAQSIDETASETTSRSGVAGLLRYALMISSLGSIASNTPPTLLNALLEHGIWSFARARSYAGRCNEGEQRARIDMQLLKRATGSLQDWCVADIIRNSKLINGRPLGCFMVALFRDLTMEMGSVLAERHIDQLFGAIREIRGSLYQLQALANLAMLHVSPLQAKAIYTYASTLFGRSGDSIDAAMDSYYCSVLRVEIELRTLCSYPPAEGKARIAILIEAIVASDDPRHLYTAIEVMSGYPGWPKLSVEYSLMSLGQMVERAIDLCTAPEEHGLHHRLLFDLLLFSDDHTDQMLIQQIRRALESQQGTIDFAERMGQLAKVRPQLVEMLIELSAKQRMSIRALCYAQLVPYLENPAAEVREVLESFSQMHDEPMVGESVQLIAPFLSPSQVRQCAEILRQLDDLPFPRALGLAALGAAHSEVSLVREALSVLHLISDADKVDRLLSAIVEETDTSLLQAAQQEVEKIGDDFAFTYGIAALFPSMTTDDRPQAGEFLARCVTSITDESSRYSALVHVLADTSPHLTPALRKSFREIISRIPSRRYPEAKIKGLMILAASDTDQNAADLKEAAIGVSCEQRDKTQELNCFCLVVNEMNEESRRAHISAIISSFESLDNSGQRYAFPRLAPLLTPREAERLAHEVVLKTPQDKYYGLGELCPWMGMPDILALLNTREQYDEFDVDQIRPDLISRCARLGNRLLAIEQCQQMGGYRCIETIRKVMPHLDFEETDKALGIVKSVKIEEHDSHEENRDEALAAIWVRFAELGDVERALSEIRKISREGVRIRGQLRMVPYLDRQRADAVLADVITIYRERLSAFERIATRNILLALPAHLVTEDIRMQFFIVSLETASRDQRSSVLFELRAFAPWLVERFGKAVASLCYKELVRVHLWWQ